MKKFTIVAGVNGAGKSTLYQLDPDLKCENGDNHLLLQISKDSVQCTGSFLCAESLQNIQGMVGQD
ncbi:hypothetical protein [Butyrivibrio proteoclasticus]|uniref:hypothetical protein n=1 Tax=Butyrivibrio proteoclasticus TaxID=43305 RepID=UPI0015A56B78|nr:hypothetical protein [Butyrivibrio proteoclasticus]